MERFEHGGDVCGLAGAAATEELLDFSASLNPLGMPEAAVQALRGNVRGFERYPDPKCRDLMAAIAEREGVAAANVLACAGATDAIARVCQAVRPVRALVCDPCYSGYEQALEQAGAAVVHHALAAADDFALGDALLEALAPDIDLVFLANPNNPTGLTVDALLIERATRMARARGAVVVLDECFLDFTDEPGAASLLARFPNLVIVRAFTKSHALAGLRVGYVLCSDAELVARCAETGQPWAVSTPAQVAALAALRAGDAYLDETREYVASAREVLARDLAGLGLRVVPGEANYLLFRSPSPLYEPLLERGIVIRRCENFCGLDASWFRVAVRAPEDNARLVAAIKEALA